MKNRVLINNGKGSIIKCPSDYSPASFSEFLADLKNGIYVDINPNNSTDSDAGVTEIGTPLNKEHLLTDEVAQGFGFDTSEDISVNDVLNRIGNDYLEGTLSANQTQLVITSSRIKATSVIEIMPSDWKCQPIDVQYSSGILTLLFDPYPTTVTFKVRVM